MQRCIPVRVKKKLRVTFRAYEYELIDMDRENVDGRLTVSDIRLGIVKGGFFWRRWWFCLFETDLRLGSDSSVLMYQFRLGSIIYLMGRRGK